MENDPVNNALAWLANFLGHPGTSIIVAFSTGSVVAYLAHMSPSKDWTYIKDGPGFILTYVWFFLALGKVGPRLVLPKSDFVCHSEPGPWGISAKTCETVTTPSHYTWEYGFGDMLRDFILSLIQDTLVGAVGAGCGLLIAILVRRAHSQ